MIWLGRQTCIRRAVAQRQDGVPLLLAQPLAGFGRMAPGASARTPSSQVQRWSVRNDKFNSAQAVALLTPLACASSNKLTNCCAYPATRSFVLAVALQVEPSAFSQDQQRRHASARAFSLRPSSFPCSLIRFLSARPGLALPASVHGSTFVPLYACRQALTCPGSNFAAAVFV